LGYRLQLPYYVKLIPNYVSTTHPNTSVIIISYKLNRIVKKMSLLYILRPAG